MSMRTPPSPPSSSSATILRRATPDDAEFLARATLGASRSHLPTGYFDLFFPVGEARLLALLARVQLATVQLEPTQLATVQLDLEAPELSGSAGGRGWGHWTDYQVLERPAEQECATRLGAICACPASALPEFPFPPQALRQAGLALGWTLAELDAAAERIRIYLEKLDDLVLSTDDATVFIQFLHVPLAHRHQGHARRMMGAILEQSRLAGRKRLELFTDLGNTPAERLYTSLGFVVVDEYRYHDFSAEELALMGPGVLRWQVQLP